MWRGLELLFSCRTTYFGIWRQDQIPLQDRPTTINLKGRLDSQSTHMDSCIVSMKLDTQ